MTFRRKQLIWIAVVFACVLIVDQVTKAIVVSLIPEGSYTPAEGVRFFRFTHQRNPGLVGGMFVTRPIMAYIAPLGACVVLAYLFRYLNPGSRVQSLAYGLVAGGAAGNLLDRFRLGSVTDFLQFHFYFIPFDFPWKMYPAFNVADSAICTGVFLLVVSWYVLGDHDAAHAV